MLVPVDRIVWAKLEAGDKRAEAAFFGHIDGGPRSLDEALNFWAQAPAPQSGFGEVSQVGRNVDKSGGKRDRVNLPSKKDEKTKASVRALHDAGLIHIDSNALKQSERDVRIGFGNTPDQVKDRVDEILSRYPTPLIDLLGQDEVRIRVVAKIDPAKDEFGRLLPGVDGRYNGANRSITVTASALHQNLGVFDEELVHAFDHLLGSRGKAGRLSEGEMVAFPGFAEIGKTIKSQFDSGEHFIDEYSKGNPREFLAAWLKEFGAIDPEDREVLRGISPVMYSVVERLLDEGFVREAMR